MNKLSQDIINWLEKYVRESWHYDGEFISVTGNVIVTDKTMEKLPVKFSEVTGDFRCMLCENLSSVEGMPTAAGAYIFEGCLFPEEFYLLAIKEKITMEECLTEHFDPELPEEVIERIIARYPSIAEVHRGQISTDKFGF